ncbi:MAG: GNAT family N-acetyltransferase [Phycisphaeraceae bacterium]|nr:GNAT family N-acetyltransferase [Phycisphaeraceae bacterium]
MAHVNLAARTTRRVGGIVGAAERTFKAACGRPGVLQAWNVAMVDGDIRDQDNDESLDCRRVEGVAHRQAVALLLGGDHQAHDAAVEHFLQFAQQQRMNLDHCWAAMRGDQPHMTALLVPSAGRTAVLFLSCVRRRRDMPMAVRLIRAVCASLDPQRIRLVQVLLDLGQKLEADALEEAGFHSLAELVYMERPIRGENRVLQRDSKIEVSHWSEDNRALFARAIIASYEQTQDCPALLGVRHIDDVMDGHRATGVFHPALWHVLHVGPEPVGVMLLSHLPSRRAIELVYLGLSVPWRGQGLGRRLVQHAMSLAGAYQADRMLLAVDRANAPALALYRGLQFVSSDHKLAMIFALP